MTIYDYDPDSGLPRDTPELPSDELATEQRRIDVAAQYAAVDAKTAAIDPARQQYQNGYDSARQMYGDSYADYLIKHDRELTSKGRALTPWPRSLQGNDGD